MKVSALTPHSKNVAMVRQESPMAEKCRDINRLGPPWPFNPMWGAEPRIGGPYELFIRQTTPPHAAGLSAVRNMGINPSRHGVGRGCIRSRISY